MRTKLRPSQLLAILPVLPILVVSWLVAGCGGKANRPPASTTSDPPPPATTTVPQQTMPEGDLSPPHGAKFGNLFRTNWTRDQLSELDEGGSARVALSGKIRHRPPPHFHRPLGSVNQAVLSQ